MQNNISFNRTYLPKSVRTTMQQRVGAALGLLICGASFATVVFYHL